MIDFFKDNPIIKKVDKKKIKIVSTIFLFIVIIIVIITLYMSNLQIREWMDLHILQKEIERNDATIIDFNSDANVEICAYDKYIGILSKNKFEIYNNSGKAENNIDIPINNVLFSNSNRFLGIAENGGQKLFLISGQSLLWENKIEGNITKISVNKNGYMAVVISDTSYKTIISLYNPNGKELFKIYLSSTRVADISISNDNKYLALAEIDTTSSVIKSNVKIISVENAQTDTDNSISYIHNADVGKLLINIKYQDKNKLLCMYDDSIDMITGEDNNEIIKYSDRKVSFASIEINNAIAIIEEKSSGLFTADSEITFINTDNYKESVYTTSDVTKEIYSCNDTLAVNLGSELHFVNKNGWLIKKYIAGQEISRIVLSESLAGIVYRDKIEIVNL
ncbi:MAG: hypothetical protein IKF17_03535 [Clostridia bacterium]|nr:hypothetical protein [Clostridia bacterium]